MRIVAIALALASILFQARAAESQAGSVCVASRAADSFRGQVIPPTGEVSSNGLRVRIDKRPSEPWPQRKSLKIDGLDIGERHLLPSSILGASPLNRFGLNSRTIRAPNCAWLTMRIREWSCRRTTGIRRGVSVKSRLFSTNGYGSGYGMHGEYQKPSTSMTALAKASGASCGRLCPMPPVMVRCAYLPANLLV